MTQKFGVRLFLWLGLCGLATTLFVAATLPGRSPDGEPGPGFGPGPVTAATPRTESWRSVADVEPGILVGSVNPCQAGRPECLDAVVEEMEVRLDDAPCAHTAPFAFTYLEMTRAVRHRVSDPGYFDSPEEMAQLDTVFARLYFDAFDNWDAGRRDEVPGAWQLAFQAADDGRTSAAADVFLGMNAHISRDLAFAVAELMGADAGLLDDPSDYRLVNAVIAEVQGPMLAEAAGRFDPNLAELDSLLPADAGVSSVDLISRRRLEALKLGRRLAMADSPQERQDVAAEIERNAVAGAVMIINADVSFPADEAPDRDAYCDAQN